MADKAVKNFPLTGRLQTAFNAGVPSGELFFIQFSDRIIPTKAERSDLRRPEPV